MLFNLAALKEACVADFWDNVIGSQGRWNPRFRRRFFFYWELEIVKYFSQLLDLMSISDENVAETRQNFVDISCFGGH